MDSPVDSEVRSFPRKLLRCNAVVVVEGLAPMRSKTKDVSLGGVCVILPEPLPIGTKCMVAFEASLHGRMVQVKATAKVAYSVLSGVEGFRTGVQFIHLDETSDKMLTELMM